MIEAGMAADGFRVLGGRARAGGRSYMHRQVEECGFRDVTSTVFTYRKPLSGPRDRVVVTARA